MKKCAGGEIDCLSLLPKDIYIYMGQFQDKSDSKRDLVHAPPAHPSSALLNASA